MTSPIFEDRRAIITLKLSNFPGEKYKDGVKAFEEQLKKELGRITSVKWIGKAYYEDTHEIEIIWESSIPEEYDMTKCEIARIAENLGKNLGKNMNTGNPFRYTVVVLSLSNYPENYEEGVEHFTENLEASLLNIIRTTRYLGENDEGMHEVLIVWHDVIKDEIDKIAQNW